MKNIFYSLCISFGCLAFISAKPTNYIVVYNKETGTDSVPKFTYTSKKFTICKKPECIKSNLEKVKSFLPSTFILIHKTDIGSWLVEENSDKFNQYINSSSIKTICIGEGNISVFEKKYPNKKYFVMIESSQ